MVAVREGEGSYLQLGGLRIHYRAWGREDAPAVILLHGGLSHSGACAAVARTLASDYRVLAPDIRGHGRSEWTTEYHTERMADDLAAFLGALQLVRPVIGGLSLGSLVATILSCPRQP